VTENGAILEVRDLHTYLFPRRGVVKAVDGVSFELQRGESLGLVGESGCGKSMTALSVLRLVPQPVARIVRGEVLLAGDDLLRKTNRDMRRVRGRQIAMVLQDPQTSLNPLMTVGTQLVEALTRYQPGSRRTLRRRAIEILRRVQLADPERRVHDYPHQMSGGMKQRVVGGIAISCAPHVLIADEPTTALDATIQLQYLNLLRSIREQTHMAILFITHDFGIVAGMCERVAVMYAGRIVETGPVREVFRHPAHPYTQALLTSIPRMTQRPARLQAIAGHPPTPYDTLLPGCRFAPRCPYADDRCQNEYPPVFNLTSDHTAHCWRLENS
jgi:oligopeptide/dipeptide ABC transporter ATP-binding protein